MAFSLVWQDNSVNTANASSYSFTSQTFGAVPNAGETRHLPVAVSTIETGGSSPFVTALTVGGTSATEQIAAEVATEAAAAIWNVNQPTGTTGTVAVTLGASADGCAIDVFRMIDPLSLTAEDTITDLTPSSGVLNLNNTQSNGGGTIGIVQSRNASTTTWNANITARSDVEPAVGNFHSAASGTTAGSPTTITATNADTTPSTYIGAVASWKPGGIPIGQALLYA